MTATTTINTQDLTGAALDWAVAKASHGMRTQQIKAGGPVHIVRMSGACDPLPYSPSTDWSQAGPIIESEGINLRAVRKEGHEFDGQWLAMSASRAGTGEMVRWVKFFWNGGKQERCRWQGETPLVAAMRCYVASKLGASVEVPAEIIA